MHTGFASETPFSRMSTPYPRREIASSRSLGRGPGVDPSPAAARHIFTNPSFAPHIDSDTTGTRASSAVPESHRTALRSCSFTLTVQRRPDGRGPGAARGPTRARQPPATFSPTRPSRRTPNPTRPVRACRPPSRNLSARLSVMFDHSHRAEFRLSPEKRGFGPENRHRRPRPSACEVSNFRMRHDRTPIPYPRRGRMPRELPVTTENPVTCRFVMACKMPTCESETRRCECDSQRGGA
jgi:hypothetical protein